MLTRLLSAIAIVLCASFARADVYSCVAPNGQSVIQGEPCARSKPGVERSAPDARVQREPAGVELNVLAITRRKCVEAGYDPEAGATFATCTDELRQTMYQRFCEQAGRTGARLDPCAYQLRSQDDRYG